MRIIDIHGHYAWGVDDGVQTEKEAIEAIKMAKNEGIEEIVATPHLICGKHQEEDVQNLKRAIEVLRTMALKEGIVIHDGCEVFLNDRYLKQFSENLIIPIANSQYVLCEFDVRKTSHSQEEFEDRLYEVELKGYKPVIAHVERYFDKKIDLKRIKDLVESGYVIQINAGSLMKKGILQKNAQLLLKHNLVHCIATDTHTVRGSRNPQVVRVYSELSKWFSENDLNLLFYENPKRIIQNQEVQKTQYKKKGLLKRYFKIFRFL